MPFGILHVRRFSAHTMNTGTVRKHGVRIAVIVSIVLLVAAANLDSPPLWFVLPSWLILAGCIAIRFSSVPHDSPYKQAFYLMGIPLLFFFGAWRTPFLDFFALVVEPSSDHLIHFVTSRPFLVLLLIYFASACLFHGMSLRKHEELHERVVERYKEHFEILKKECERLAQKSQ